MSPLYHIVHLTRHALTALSCLPTLSCSINALAVLGSPFSLSLIPGSPTDAKLSRRAPGGRYALRCESTPWPFRSCMSCHARLHGSMFLAGLSISRPSRPPATWSACNNF